MDLRRRFRRRGLLLPVSLLLLAAAARSGEIHVSPSGDDAFSGTREKPFATLQRAREAAREQRAAYGEPVTVILHAGEYFLSRPLVFTSEDSGRKDAPVVYRALPGDKVVISGGRRLSPGTAIRRDSRGTAWIRFSQAPPPFDQIFMDGRRMDLARWPDREPKEGVDTGYVRGLTPIEGEAGPPLEIPIIPYAGFRFDTGMLPDRDWSRPKEAVLHIFQKHGWGSLQWRLRDVDRKAGRLGLGEGGWQIGTLWWTRRANEVGPESRFFIENIREELTAPGEWYFDRETRELSFIPPAGADMKPGRVVMAGRLPELIVFQGTAERPVRHIHLRGLEFSHTARTFLEPYETRLRGDWGIRRKAAVRLEGAEECSISACRFVHLGGNAVMVSGCNRRIEVEGSLFQDIGESAVCLVGRDSAVRELRVHREAHVPLENLTDRAPGPKSSDYPERCRVQDNLMFDLGIYGKQTAGVYISAARDITVRHNTIARIPRAGICINDGCWGGHVIEFNDLFLTVRETSDHGPLNAWGRDRYWQSRHREGRPCDMTLSKAYARLDSHRPTVIRHNRFAHPAEDGDFSWGIDLDDGASHYLVTGNLTLGCSVKLREGYFRTVSNNIFIGPHPPSKHAGFEDSGDVLTRNIYVNTRDGWAFDRGPGLRHLPLQMDDNLYFNTAGEEPVFGVSAGIDERRRLTWEEWRRLGPDRHSLVSDPLFVDFEGGDYTLRAESPALRLGFQPFPLDRFGTRVPELKALAERLRPSR